LRGVVRPAPALLTAREIAALLDLKDAQRVLDLRRHRLGFPQPVGRRRRALVWLRSDVEAWAAAEGSERLVNEAGHHAVTEPSSRRDRAETLHP